MLLGIDREHECCDSAISRSHRISWISWRHDHEFDGRYRVLRNRIWPSAETWLAAIDCFVRRDRSASLILDQRQLDFGNDYADSSNQCNQSVANRSLENRS